MFSKRIYRFLLFLFLFNCIPSIGQVKSTDIKTIGGKKYYLHEIEKKQSLYAISKLYNVSLDELYQLNPDLKNGAKAGQQILIPIVSVPAPAVQTSTISAAPIQADTSRFITYRVMKGETMYAITRKYNLTEKELLAYNPSLSEGLKEGQLLVVGEKKKKALPKEQKEIKIVKTEKEARPIEKEIRTGSIFVDSSLFVPVAKPKKSSYNIALMLPYKLDQVSEMDPNEIIRSNSNFPAVPALALDFYLGFKKAADSLASEDFGINILPYDVDDSDSSKLSQMTAESRFKDLDMIFGPLYANRLKVIAQKVQELHIPLISPITQQNKILFNNIYISKTNPSQFTLLESLADYCLDSLLSNNANVILMSAFEKDKREIAFVNAFKRYFNEKITLKGKPLKDTLTMAKGIEGVKKAYVPQVKNIVISLSNSQVFVADFSTQLAMFSDKKDITLCGWQNISEMDNIDQEYLNQLNFTFPHQFNLKGISNYGTLIDWYKGKQETFPGEYFFMGFDIGWYYLKNLKETGPGFIYQLDTRPMETNYMRFQFTRPDASTGFDNRGVYIFKYKNYQLHKTGWK